MRGSNFPDMPFSQQISFPCELTLHNTRGGLRVFRKPIAEIELLHQAPSSWTNRALQANQELLLDPNGRLFHVKATLEICDNAKAIFNVRGNSVVLTSKALQSGNPSVSVADKIESVEMLVDVGSIETFVNDGELSSTRFALAHENKFSVKAEGGPVLLKSLVVFPLKSAWTETK
jgi:levanase/fructan beta-fructosidase